MTRVLSGAVLIAIAIAVIWFAPPLVFFAVAIAFAIAGAHELVALAHASGIAVPRLPSELGAGLVLVATHTAMPIGAVTVALLAVFIALALATLGAWRGGPDAMASVSASLLPSIYVALPIAALVSIRVREGPAALFLLIATIIVSDTAQYYAGRLVGQRPLAPSISPKKTIEGAVAGFLFGGLALTVAGGWWLPDLPVALRVALGLAVVALGIAGDLFESMLKRSAGVKDSSSLIPGHGGVLDRIDALLFAAPVYFIVVTYA